MPLLCFFFLFLTLLLTQSAASAQVTTRKDTVGELLNEWFREGTAAGLSGVTYENRDGQHSALEAGVYPQLTLFAHSAATGPDKGPSSQLRAAPTVGNCSMAAPAEMGGSLPRFYLMDPKGAQFLMAQYLANQLFLYPEHQDHDAGGNGVGGYGDLYPANTPCCLITQGSSGSDQPFLRAVLATMAAFPRETQRVLIQRRLLMPTVQAILRQNNRLVSKPEDILSGRAHPVVFDASMLDEERMVRAAHAMTPERIPPLAQAIVVQESIAENGVDFFEASPPPVSAVADARVSIARVLRSITQDHAMLLDLSKCADLLGRPLGVKIVVLQGDPAGVKIDRTGATPYARLRVRWQPPRPGARGVLCHRVDIGIFVTNGVSVSAPAILSFAMLPNERRFYHEDGRVAEIDYQAANPDLGLPTAETDLRWLKVMRAATQEASGLGGRLMARLLGEEARRSLRALLPEWEDRLAALPSLEASNAESDKKKAALLRSKLEIDFSAILNQAWPSLNGKTLRVALHEAFEQIANVPDLYLSFRAELDALAAKSSQASAKADVAQEVQRLIDLGILIATADGTLSTVTASDRLSTADRHYLRGLNLTVMSQALFPEALQRSPRPAYVPPRLSTPKPWRDVFRYEPTTGRLLGWLRHQAGRVHAFDARGRLLPEGPDRPELAVPVRYEINSQGLLQWKP